MREIYFGEMKMDIHILGFGFRNYEQFVKLREFFENDYNKLWAWFHASNSNLGNSSPRTLIILGREEKLIKFIENALSENKLEEK